MRSPWNAVVAAIVLAIGLVTGVEAQERTPFEGVRFPTSDAVEVEVRETWYGLVAIDEVRVEVLLKHAQAEHGEKWGKRVGEDLVRLFEELGEELGDTVDLVLTDLASGERVELSDVPATTANRRRIWAAGKRANEASAPRGDRLLEPIAWQADLGELERLLSQEFAYVGLTGVEPAEACAELRRELGDRPVDLATFARKVHATICRFGDGHAGVQEEREFLREGYLPFLLRPARGGVVAFHPDRSAFASPEHPFLVSIDGVPLELWTQAAAKHVAAGSKQLVERRALERMRWLQQLREELGLATSDTLTCVFRNRDGHTNEVTMPVAERRPTYGTWPPRETTGVGNLPYLRVASMDSAEELGGRVTKFLLTHQEAETIVLDVRGNGGGERDLLLLLAPWLLGPKDAPVVVNVAEYALGPEEREDLVEGHLANRYLWPANWLGWSRAASRAIQKFERKFEPRGSVDAKLSGRHYLVLEKPENHPTLSGTLIVLQDAGCFSATDVFLAAVKELPGVLTVGTPSSGGSARTQRHRLEHSSLTVRLASMASRMPDGRFFDGNGVEPDVRYEPEPFDFFTHQLTGGGDSVLTRAELLAAKGYPRDVIERRK